MRFILVLLVFIFTFIACDNPQRTRFQSTPGDSNFGVDGFGDDGGGSGGNGGNGGSGGDDDDDDNDPLEAPGFENCSLGMQYYGGPNIGYLALCQSSENENMFKVKMAQSDPTVGTCFVPIHIVGQTSFKLGIAECVNNVANQVYDMTLTKERPEPINGVMVIKAGAAVINYMRCMNAKVHYMTGFPPPLQPPFYPDNECIGSAGGNPDAYAFCVCTKFKGTYSTFYKQIALPAQ